MAKFLLTNEQLENLRSWLRLDRRRRLPGRLYQHILMSESHILTWREVMLLREHMTAYEQMMLRPDVTLTERDLELIAAHHLPFSRPPGIRPGTWWRLRHGDLECSVSWKEWEAAWRAFPPLLRYQFEYAQPYGPRV